MSPPDRAFASTDALPAEFVAAHAETVRAALRRLAAGYGGRLGWWIDDALEDTTTDVLIHAVVAVRAGKYEKRSDASFDAWLRKVAERLFRDSVRHLRREKRDVGREATGTERHDALARRAAQTATGAATRIDREADRGRIEHALAALDPKDSAVIRMRDFDNRAWDAIGAALGCSEDAARMRRQTALAKLRLKLLKLESE